MNTQPKETVVTILIISLEMQC